MIYRILSKIERTCAKYQGKGWGANTFLEEVKCLNKILLNPHIGIDIGANVGKYSEQLRKAFPDMEIHLFEPSIINADILNVKFKNDKKTFINIMAVSDNNGNAELFSERPGSGLASLTKRRLDHFGLDFNNAENVATIRFEDFWKTELNSREIDVIKIDVEGHELKVLSGLGEAIKHVKIIQFEFGGCNIDSKTYFQDFWYFFQDHSFHIYRITPIGIQPITRYSEYDETFTTTNFICINNN